MDIDETALACLSSGTVNSCLAAGGVIHTLNQSRTCCTVRSPSRIQRSQSVHFKSLKV